MNQNLPRTEYCHCAESHRLKLQLKAERLRADGLEKELDGCRKSIRAEIVKDARAKVIKDLQSKLEEAEKKADGLVKAYSTDYAQLQARSEAYEMVLEKIYADGRGCEVFPKSHTGEPATDGFVAVEEVLNRTHKGESNG